VKHLVALAALVVVVSSVAVANVVRGSQLPDPWVDPGFAKLLWIQSPHFNQRPAEAVIDTVVVHSTVAPTLHATTKWFVTPEARVSAHYTIGKDGSIVQHVSTFERAWHAGVSQFKGRENVNDFSIGIELVNLNDGKDPYPPEQIEALRFLVSHLKRRFDLRYITSHEYVALPPGRKNDPKGFPWETMRDLGLDIVL
jgi:N-acetylmuramoyl-L-alanine amidase